MIIEVINKDNVSHTFSGMSHWFQWVSTRYVPVSILYKSIAGRYRPVRVADGPITARYRFIKNASWGLTQSKKRLPNTPFTRSYQTWHLFQTTSSIIWNGVKCKNFTGNYFILSSATVSYWQRLGFKWLHTLDCHKSCISSTDLKVVVEIRW